MNSKLKTPQNDFLFEAVLTLKDTEECYAFFEDLCTVNELQAMAQRLQVAKLLSESHSYHDIVAKTLASTATISRVNRCLQYGADGYRKVLARLSDK